MEVFNQRLEQEYNASVIITAPTVPYKAILSSAKLIKVRAGSCTYIFQFYCWGLLTLITLEWFIDLVAVMSLEYLPVEWYTLGKKPLRDCSKGFSVMTAGELNASCRKCVSTLKTRTAIIRIRVSYSNIIQNVLFVRTEIWWKTFFISSSWNKWICVTIVILCLNLLLFPGTWQWRAHHCEPSSVPD